MSNLRPLENLVVGMSVSEPEDLAEFGYTSADVNRAIVRLSEALLSTGARLIFGHDWRPDGIMDAVCRLAIRYQPSDQVNASQPLIQSLLAWPNTSSMEPTLRRELEQRGVLRIEMLPAPPDVGREPTELSRALSLFHMRKELATRCDARVCLGGKAGRDKKRPVQGFYSGIVEEAVRAIQEGRPVYIGSFLGGVSAIMADILQAETALAHDVFTVVPYRKSELQKAVARDKKLDPEDQVLQGHLPTDLAPLFSRSELQKRSGLNENWKELLDAPDTESFVTWVIRGLRQVAKQRAEAEATPTKAPKPRAAKKRPKKRRANP